MLPEFLQQQLLTDLVYGKDIDTDLQKLSEPYRLAIRVCRLAPAKDRLDLLFDLGNYNEQLKDVVKAVQGRKFDEDLSVFDEDWAQASALEPAVEWLWPEWIPRRHLSLMVSYGGVGKSAMVLDWVGRWLTGRPMPDGKPINRTKDAIIFCDGEDFFQEYAARTKTWQAANLWPTTEHTGIFLHRRLAKAKDAHLYQTKNKWQLIDFADEMERDRLLALVYRQKPEWLIIDSVSATFAESTFDKDVREPLAFLTHLAHEYNLAITLIHHYNKQQRLDQPPDVTNIKGAGAFVNFCRSNFTLHYERVTNTEKVDRKRDPRILSPLKTNFAVPDEIGVWFKPLHPAGFYIEYVPAEEIKRQAADLRAQEEEEQSQRVIDECADWLTVHLREQGPASRQDVITAAGKKGYKPFVVDQARTSLGEMVIDTLGKRVKGNKWAFANDEDQTEDYSSPGLWDND